ncbi:MAG: succinyl-diaminopimelate desuccinylase [Gammaproteobacteria bacterium]|nr:succinyl-diaminopimelate desuccinylase [Gammaproteobacteria bacterium]MCP4274863.1 succinyl-diaminopimelate desuccinylase [Gammaproteobacteria bacterium]MCP4832070.1 succinyl-diaminopimelate desuccinylase [Gammaproteobacteria bacterium]MCP4928329.1 succinyl-diaminopimelate desuccinylase [Gammaproteobacteria bacterium]
MNSTLQFAIDLIELKSITPDDAGCMDLITTRLKEAGFTTERLNFGEEGGPGDDVSNLWATHGTGGPVLCFAGHTDVVPTGPLEEWQSDPFKAEIRDDKLFGRGAADMKCSLAAMVDAAASFTNNHPDHKGTIAFLITSDEEGRAQGGTKSTIRTLNERGIHIDWCVIGEPSSSNKLGDTVKVGRRGSLSGMLTVHGVQGHVAYPQLADNPIERFAPALAELYAMTLDKGNDYFPPSSFQVVQLQSGTGFPNVTPGELFTRFNFRYSTVWNHEQLKEHVSTILNKHKLEFTLDWHLSGEPFLTEGGELIPAMQQAVKTVTGLDPELSTSGGTSDGRFISPAGAQVVEFGTVNATIHKSNEEILIDDIESMRATHAEILRLLML